MSMRIDPSWVVLRSVEDVHHERCVDLFERPDGTFGFEEFRRDIEDQGRWTATAYYSGKGYPSHQAAWEAAKATVAWLS
jgi:hypothetical protein